MSGQGGAATLNLQTATDLCDPTILLHFNPRRPQAQIVRNSKKHGRWNREERSGGFPFQNKNRWSYELTMRDTSVDMVVDDKPFGNFLLRGARCIQSVRYFNIWNTTGDIIVETSF